jgi:Uma2 family endonuclease
MGLVNKILPHYTYDDYVHWEGRWELIEGHPIAMSPLPIPEHQRVAAELRSEFIVALKRSKCKNCTAYDPLDYKISDDTVLGPDILIVCGKISKKFLDFPPVLVVEVLSTSTELRDRNTKYDFYQQQGVKYYLIVDTKKQTIEIYKLIENQYLLQEFNKDYEFLFDNECRVTPSLTNVWE